MSRDQALEVAQKADVVIYAISTNTKRDDQDGDKVLQVPDGGNRRAGVFSFQGGRPGSEFREHCQRIAAPVQYLLPAGTTQNGWPVPSSVIVKVKTRRDLIVKARKGVTTRQKL